MVLGKSCTHKLLNSRMFGVMWKFFKSLLSRAIYIKPKLRKRADPLIWIWLRCDRYLYYKVIHFIFERPPVLECNTRVMRYRSKHLGIQDSVYIRCCLKLFTVGYLAFLL